MPGGATSPFENVVTIPEDLLDSFEVFKDPGKIKPAPETDPDPETNPYFNQPVGAKTGGTMKYKKDEVYDLTQAEIGAILAAGGQIKFI